MHTIYALSVLSHPVRLQIFRLLLRSGQQGMPMGAVAERLEMPASTLKFHLVRLAEAGLVTQQKVGRAVYSYASMDSLRAAMQALEAECCLDVLAEGEKHSHHEENHV